ncbi:MAG: hypothetical protein D6732_12325, partial [Methanobacteriota archaeon]
MLRGNFSELPIGEGLPLKHIHPVSATEILPGKQPTLLRYVFVVRVMVKFIMLWEWFKRIIFFRDGGEGSGDFGIAQFGLVEMQGEW